MKTIELKNNISQIDCEKLIIKPLSIDELL